VGAAEYVSATPLLREIKHATGGSKKLL